MTSISERGGRTMSQFCVGDVVTCIPHLIPRTAAPGDYKIVAAMPDRNGDRVYRIKSPLEEHERVVGENLLVRSVGYLPFDRRRERRSGRLQRLSAIIGALSGLGWDPVRNASGSANPPRNSANRRPELPLVRPATAQMLASSVCPLSRMTTRITVSVVLRRSSAGSCPRCPVVLHPRDAQRASPICRYIRGQTRAPVTQCGGNGERSPIAQCKNPPG